MKFDYSVVMPAKQSRPHVPYSADFGLYLKNKRVAKNYSQAELAAALQYDTAQVVSNWERGIQAPPFEKLLVLCKILNIPKKDILKKLMDEQTKVYEDHLQKLWSSSKASAEKTRKEA
jgi:transcriptional regulator with XRE-family HTH domain